MCLILISPANKNIYLLFPPVFINVLTTLSFFYICLCYLLIYKHVQQSKTRLASFAEAKSKQSVPLHFLLITFSNVLCWAPVSAISFLTIGGYNVSSKVLIAIVSIAMPINSILNPLFYTITTKTFVKSLRNALKILHLKSGKGMKTYVSQWTVKEGIVCVYRYLLHNHDNGIVHYMEYMLIWSCATSWLVPLQWCFSQN